MFVLVRDDDDFDALGQSLTRCEPVQTIYLHHYCINILVVHHTVSLALLDNIDDTRILNVVD
jgi:hypothetical protein